MGSNCEKILILWFNTFAPCTFTIMLCFFFYEKTRIENTSEINQQNHQKPLKHTNFVEPTLPNIMNSSNVIVSDHHDQKEFMDPFVVFPKIYRISTSGHSVFLLGLFGTIMYVQINDHINILAVVESTTSCRVRYSGRMCSRYGSPSRK